MSKGVLEDKVRERGSEDKRKRRGERREKEREEGRKRKGERRERGCIIFILTLASQQEEIHTPSADCKGTPPT